MQFFHIIYTLDIMDNYYLGPLCKLRDWIPNEKINWYYLSSNPNAIHLLEQNMDKIDWHNLSLNPNSIPILEKNMDKINWYWLSSNPNAIHLLEQNIDKIDWQYLSKNPNAIHLLEQNPKKIDWWSLSANPYIFEYDWVAMRNRMNLFKEELVAKQFHPKNMSKFVSWGFEEFADLEF